MIYLPNQRIIITARCFFVDVPVKYRFAFRNCLLTVISFYLASPGWAFVLCWVLGTRALQFYRTQLLGLSVDLIYSSVTCFSDYLLTSLSTTYDHRDQINCKYICLDMFQVGPCLLLLCIFIYWFFGLCLELKVMRCYSIKANGIICYQCCHFYNLTQILYPVPSSHKQLASSRN